MDVFSTAWVDGEIKDIGDLIQKNSFRKFMFVLDTNFVIMARYYVMDRNLFNKVYREQKEDFENAVYVLNQNASRIVYAQACEEASRSKITGNIDPEKYRIMVECLEEIFKMKLNKMILSKNESINEDLTFSKVPLLLKNGLFRKQHVITYTTVLKTYLLKHFDNRDSKAKIKDMLYFMAHQINAFSPVATSFVIHYLGEEPNILKKANPSKGLEKILQKLYSASIDMLMPTQASQLSEISGYYEVPIFVTFDQGMKLIFDSLLISGEHKLESGVKVPKYSFMIFYSSGWSDEEIYELSQISFEMQKDKRMTKENKVNELLRINKLAMKLEEELARNLNYGLLSKKP